MTMRQLFAKTVTGWLLVPLLLAAAGIWFALDPGFRGGSVTAQTSPQAPADDFERRVRDYLLANPEVIVEALERFEAQRRAAEQSEGEAALKAHAEEVYRDPASPVGGNPDGDVTMIEFFDYNCPYCRQMAPTVSEIIAGDDKLRVVYKEFPILGQGSVFAAQAALAADRQGRYAAFHEALMKSTDPANESSVLAIAAETGLDVERLKTDMKDPEIGAAIQRNLALAEALRISGTPSFIIGERIVPGAADTKTLQELIHEAREQN